MNRKRILWADDEIDMLRGHILFLHEKGYDVTPVNSGHDAVEYITKDTFDIIFLDENMPGISGLDTLKRIKEIAPHVPVVMITKSEDEGIMTHAIGSKIADYLIKPVNPHQILLSLKKNLDKDEIISETTLEGYRSEFAKISELLNSSLDVDKWCDLYRKIAHWEIELNNTQSPLVESVLMQKQEANQRFGKFIKEHYESWIAKAEKRPTLSHELLQRKVFPQISNGEKVLFLLIDNFRLDQWFAVKDLLGSSLNISEEVYCSILPTATQYARNAIFAGLLPEQIASMYPHLWVNEDSEESKNNSEEELLKLQIERLKMDFSLSYHKILSSSAGEKLIQHISPSTKYDLTVAVINFVDAMSHARTESKMMRELAADEAAYRSLTRSWFKHSSTLELIKKALDSGYKIVLTTDHGTIRVRNSLKIIGEKDTSSNVRYKTGRNIEYDRKKVYDIHSPKKIGLPLSHISSKYIFALGDDFFVYPNNYNHYASYYTDTFQHGGISMEEMIVPLITITTKQ